MVIVAGPPGSGKTTPFSVAEFGVDSFNADNRAAQLNDGSFRGISKEIRSQVNVEFQKWILDHISTRKSFALETTLRSQVTFEQTHLAREHGFWTSYITSRLVASKNALNASRPAPTVEATQRPRESFATSIKRVRTIL